MSTTALVGVEVQLKAIVKKGSPQRSHRVGQNVWGNWLDFIIEEVKRPNPRKLHGLGRECWLREVDLAYTER